MEVIKKISAHAWGANNGDLLFWQRKYINIVRYQNALACAQVLGFELSRFQTFAILKAPHSRGWFYDSLSSGFFREVRDHTTGYRMDTWCFTGSLNYHSFSSILYGLNIQYPCWSIVRTQQLLSSSMYYEYVPSLVGWVQSDDDVSLNVSYIWALLLSRQ